MTTSNAVLQAQSQSTQANAHPIRRARQPGMTGHNDRNLLTKELTVFQTTAFDVIGPRREVIEVLSWLEDNVERSNVTDCVVLNDAARFKVEFYNDADAVLFKLRWMGN